MLRIKGMKVFYYTQKGGLQSRVKTNQNNSR